MCRGLKSLQTYLDRNLGVLNGCPLDCIRDGYNGGVGMNYYIYDICSETCHNKKSCNAQQHRFVNITSYAICYCY